MAFVNEKFPSEIGKSRTIDYERDASLTGGWRVNGSDECKFGINWKGHEILFTAIFKSTKGETVDIFYDVCSCQYPEELRCFIIEMRELISDALNMFGLDHYKSANYRVFVTFDEKLKALSPYYNWDKKCFEENPVIVNRNLN